MTQKEWADKLLHFVGDDFDEHLKRVHHIRDFHIGIITANAAGTALNVSLYEDPKNGRTGKNYTIEFNLYLLILPDYYQALDRENMKNIPEDNKMLRARLRVQSALFRLYKEKDKQKKNQVGRNLVKVELAAGGELLWR